MMTADEIHDGIGEIGPYRPLLTPAEIGQYARPCDADRATAERAIEEAVLMDVRPKIGSTLYYRLTHGVQFGLLLEGGSYTARPCGGPDEVVRVFGGLKRALAYYAYGRIVRTGDATVTRFGYVKKNDEYSEKPDFKERLAAYEDAFATADTYMNECLVYMLDNPALFPDYHGGGRVRSTRTRFKVIGH